MKTFFRSASLVLALSLLLSVVGFAADGREPRSGELKFISYNIQGLPFVTGEKGVQLEKTRAVGKLLTKDSYDVACLQEDFFYHIYLDPEVDMPYSSRFSGIAPVGDGLSMYSVHPMFSTARVRWDTAAGVFDGGSDALTPKGFMVTTLKVSDGVFIDVYNLHADANSEPPSVAARRDNFSQLARFINSYSADRAVVLLGDFNSRLCDTGDGLYELLIEPCALKDAWCETANGGDYLNIPPDAPDGGFFWGHWDSLDRVMYRSGGGVSLDILSHEYVFHRNEAGESLSDHSALEAELRWSVTGELPIYDCLTPGDTIGPLEDIIRKLRIFIEVALLALSEASLLLYNKYLST